MSRKILITFLGAGNPEKTENRRVYRKAIYFIKDKCEFPPSPFVAAILYDYLQIDTIYMIGTMKSMWEAVYEHFTERQSLPIDEDYYVQLGSQSENATYQTPINKKLFAPLEKVLGNDSRILPIKYGLTAQETWDNFASITELFKNLRDGDQIYLDITHSFRSLPLFSTTAIMYLQDVIGKKVKVKKIYYGMLDAMREFDFKAPIVELSSLSEMQEWIKGAYALQQFGNGELIAQLTKRSDKQWADSLLNLSIALSFNYAQEIRDKLKLMPMGKLSGPASLVIPDMVEKLKNQLASVQTEAEFQIELARWYAKKGNFGAAYIIMVEAIITFVCEEERWDFKNANWRNKAKEAISRGKYKQLLNQNDFFTHINSARRVIAHASLESKVHLEKDYKQLIPRLNKARKIIFKS